MFIFPRKALKLLAVALCVPTLALAQAAPAPIKVAMIEGLSGAFANQLERASVTFASQAGTMRASDHQFQQPLVVAVMDRQDAPGVKFDVEGSGYGFAS